MSFYQTFTDSVQFFDEDLVKFLAQQMLGILRVCQKQGLSIRRLKSKRLFIDHHLNIKLDFIQGLCVSQEREFKEEICSVGLNIIRFIFKDVVDHILDLMSIALKDILLVSEPKKASDHWKLTHFFGVTGYKYLFLSPVLRNESCCFYHCVLGKLRSMT